MERKATIYDYSRFTASLCDRRSYGCKGCKLSSFNNGHNVGCASLITTYPDEANEIILKWCDEHPEKTYADDFFSKFPNAERKADNKTPNVCINRIYPHAVKGDCNTCDLCWAKTYKENNDD